MITHSVKYKLIFSGKKQISDCLGIGAGGIIMKHGEDLGGDRFIILILMIVSQVQHMSTCIKLFFIFLDFIYS